jgi:hypothetical protein
MIKSRSGSRGSGFGSLVEVSLINWLLLWAHLLSNSSW